MVSSRRLEAGELGVLSGTERAASSSYMSWKRIRDRSSALEASVSSTRESMAVWPLDCGPSSGCRIGLRSELAGRNSSEGLGIFQYGMSIAAAHMHYAFTTAENRP